MTVLQPLYSDRSITPAYHLRYDWTGWPTEGESLPERLKEVIEGTKEAWEADGMRVLEGRCARDKIQVLFSVKPSVSPVLCSGRAKGRLQYALRKAGCGVAFSRKLSFRTIGDNTTADVEQYVLSQVGRQSPIDQELLGFTLADPTVDLRAPSETLSGRYWYNLHLVLVTAERYRVGDPQRLGRLRDQAISIARKKGCAISRLAVLPDHLHIALRGNIDHSPQEIALAFQNNLAYVLGQCRLWQDTYYVGTFSEYDIGAIRSCIRKEESEGPL